MNFSFVYKIILFSIANLHAINYKNFYQNLTIILLQTKCTIILYKNVMHTLPFIYRIWFDSLKVKPSLNVDG